MVPDASKEFNFESSLRLLLHSASLFALTLHNNDNFSRHNVQEIIDEVKQLILKPVVEISKNLVKEISKKKICEIEAIQILENLDNIFTHVNTEHKLTTCLVQENLLQNPKTFTIWNEVGPVIKTGQLFVDEINTTGVILPLKFYFKKNFEKNNNLSSMFKSMKDTDTDCDYIESFAQTSLWKRK